MTDLPADDLAVWMAKLLAKGSSASDKARAQWAGGLAAAAEGAVAAAEAAPLGEQRSLLSVAARAAVTVVEGFSPQVRVFAKLIEGGFIS
jgi:hypothetical protein